MSDAAIRHLRKDPKLARIIDMVGDYEIKRRPRRFESLVDIIITQQLSGTAAASISKRFRGIYKARFPKPADVAKTPDSKLRKAGLSIRKAEYIKELARQVDSGEIRLEKLADMSDDEVVTALTRIRGMGQWSAEMFLMFTLGRMDVFPVGDLGIRRGVALLYNMKKFPTVSRMIKIAEPWRPYRTVATWYIWKSQEFDI